MRRFRRSARRSGSRWRAGERVLAWADVGGPATRARRHPGGALPARGDRRIPWEQVEAADWDHDSATLRVSEVGTWGEPRPTHRFTLDEPGRLLELVRERVTASVVLQRHVPIGGRRGVRVIARRAPTGDRRLQLALRVRRGHRPRRPGRPAGRRRGPRGRPAEVGVGLTPSIFQSSGDRLANLCGLHRSPVAQLAEHSTVNRRVVGSSPTGGASLDGGSITGPPSCCLRFARW